MRVPSIKSVEWILVIGAAVGLGACKQRAPLGAGSSLAGAGLAAATGPCQELTEKEVKEFEELQRKKLAGEQLTAAEEARFKELVERNVARRMFITSLAVADSKSKTWESPARFILATDIANEGGANTTVEQMMAKEPTVADQETGDIKNKEEMAKVAAGQRDLAGVRGVSDGELVERAARTEQAAIAGVPDYAETLKERLRERIESAASSEGQYSREELARIAVETQSLKLALQKSPEMFNSGDAGRVRTLVELASANALVLSLYIERSPEKKAEIFTDYSQEGRVMTAQEVVQQEIREINTMVGNNEMGKTAVADFAIENGLKALANGNNQSFDVFKTEAVAIRGGNVQEVANRVNERAVDMMSAPNATADSVSKLGASLAEIYSKMGMESGRSFLESSPSAGRIAEISDRLATAEVGKTEEIRKELVETVKRAATEMQERGGRVVEIKPVEAPKARPRR